MTDNQHTDKPHRAEYTDSSPVRTARQSTGSQIVKSTFGSQFGSSDKVTTRLMPSENNKPYPFKAPRLIIPQPGSKDQRWLIRMKVWDADKQKLVQIDDYESLKDYTNIKQREKYGKWLCDDYLRRLEAGEHLHYSKKKEQEQRESAKRNIHLQAASVSLESALEAKKRNVRQRTYQTYKNISKRFTAWLESGNYSSYAITDVSPEIITEYLNYLQDCGVSRRTRNNHMVELKILFASLKIKAPFEDIKKLKTPTGKNVAYSEELKKKIREHVRDIPEMRFAILFIYHTWMRTNEMAHIKFSNIGQYRPDRIYLEADYSKNIHERHVPIHPEIMDELYRLKNLYPPDWHPFGGTFKPSEEKTASSNLGHHYTRAVLRPLEIENPLYTFYSWKHTGVVDYWTTPGANYADAMQQGGWRSPESLSKYLKSLGLSERENRITQIKPNLYG